MIKAIDIHSHINSGSVYDMKTNDMYTAEKDEIIAINQSAGIDLNFVSTFASVLSDKDIEKENEYMFETAKNDKRLYQWLVIDPKNKATYFQARKMMGSKKCVGIKLHPPYHHYSIEEYGDEIFSFASEFGAVVLIHPEKDADYILPFADRYPAVSFIMAHLGSYDGTKYARAIRNAKHKNVYVDTSGIASSNNMVIEYTVKKAGSEHILFGTDTYAAGFQRGRIEYALISDEDKENILRKNAEKLFGEFIKEQKEI